MKAVVATGGPDVRTCPRENATGLTRRCCRLVVAELAGVPAGAAADVVRAAVARAVRRLGQPAAPGDMAVPTAAELEQWDASARRLAGASVPSTGVTR